MNSARSFSLGPDRQSEHRGYLGLVILALLYATVCVTTLIIFETAQQAILFSGVVTLLAIPFVRGVTNKDFNLFDPVVYTTVYLILAYPVQLIYATVFPEAYSNRTMSFWENARLVNLGLWYILMGIAVYLATYYHASKLLLRPACAVRDEQDSSNLLGPVILIFLLGWGFRLYMMATGNFGTFFTWSGFNLGTAAFLYTWSKLTWLAFILGWVHWFRGSRDIPTILVVFGITAIEVFFHLMVSGSKTYLAHLALFPIMVAYLFGRRLSPLAIAVFMLLLVFFIFPFVAEFRLVHSELKFEGVDFASSAVLLQVVLERLTDSFDLVEWDMITSFLESFLGRFHGFESLIVLFRQVPNHIDYLYWNDASLILFSLFPRFLFPEKPANVTVELFSEQVYQSTGAISLFPIGEGYFNYGLLGILVLMASLGLVQAFYQRLLPRARQSGYFGLAVYVYLFFTVTNVDSSLLMTYGGLVQQVPVLVVAYLLAFRGPPFLRQIHTVLMSKAPFAERFSVSTKARS